MKDPVKRLITEAGRHQIEACVRAAEIRTRGEIVVIVVPASHHYPMALLLGATAFAFPVAVALTPLLGGLFWAGPSNLWVFLAALIPLFLIGHEVLKRIPAMKRCFISDSEMEEEVKEAADIQFFRKGLYRTREETGVLFYVSVFERRVRVIGDRGINSRIPDEYWKKVAAAIVQAIREGRAADGICRAVTQVAGVLEEKFPVRSDDADELKNVMVEDRSA